MRFSRARDAQTFWHGDGSSIWEDIYLKIVIFSRLHIVKVLVPYTLIGDEDIPFRSSIIADSTRRSELEILPSHVPQFNLVSII